MKPYRVEFAAEAEAQAAKIRAWWRANRTAAPTLFDDELAEAVRLLAETPYAGPPYRRRGGFRWLLLRRCRYAAYYTIDDDLGFVHIVAIWHTSRGKGPPLGPKR